MRSGFRNTTWESIVLLASLVYGIVSSYGFAPAYMGNDYVPDEVLVKFKTGKAAMAQSFHAQIGSRVAGSLAVSKVSRVMLPKDVTVSEAVRLYSENPAVEFAEPNYILHFVNTYPNDPQFSNQWGHENTGQFGGTPDADIDSVEAWDTSVGSDSIVVAITDTGIDLRHPDLEANIWTNPGEDPWTDPYDHTTGNGIDDDLNGYVDDWKGYDFCGAWLLFSNPDNDPSDGVGHGTHVSGIVAARGNNQIGVAGVSWNAKIMPLKIGPDAEEILNVFVAAEAIDYAVANGADIVNASWGAQLVSSGTIRTAIENAHSAGVLFVAAAGNEETDNDGWLKFYPASHQVENIISVAATNGIDGLATFSNFGRINVDVGAPGGMIISTMPTYEVYYNQWYNMNYDYLNGT
jgi:subtilisin family serine protease